MTITDDDQRRAGRQRPMQLLRPARQAVEDLREKIDQRLEDIEAVSNDDSRTPDYIARQTAELRERLSEEVRVERDRITSQLDAAEQATAAVVRGDLATASEIGSVERASRRVARMLDGGAAPDVVVQTLSEAEDADGLRALRAEVPALAAVMTTTGGGVAADRRRLTLELLRQVDDALRPLVGSVERRAIDAQQEIADLRQLLAQLYAWASTAATGGSYRASNRLELAYAQADVTRSQDRTRGRA